MYMYIYTTRIYRYARKREPRVYRTRLLDKVTPRINGRGERIHCVMARRGRGAAALECIFARRATRKIGPAQS